jgi:hypothetical protein
MHRRFTLAATVVACGTALALAIPATAGASQATHRLDSGITSSDATNTSTKSHPFHVKPGRIFDVTATLHGVRKNDRLALESYFRAHRHNPKKWHILGSWRLHRGARHFRGRTYGSYPGLFTLRVQFLRHGQRLSGSQSNRFYVKVLRFHVHKLRRPHHASSVPNLHGLAIPNTSSVSDWTSVECADPAAGGAGVVVPPPFRSLGNSNVVNVYQVAFARDANPGGNYGNWYAASVQPQTVQPAGSDNNQDAFSIGAGNLTYRPDQLGTVPELSYVGSTEYHQIGWDLQVQLADGSWEWVYNDIVTPGSYIQYAQDGSGSSQSANCETFPGVGF